MTPRIFTWLLSCREQVDTQESFLALSLEGEVDTQEFLLALGLQGDVGTHDFQRFSHGKVDNWNETSIYWASCQAGLHSASYFHRRQIDELFEYLPHRLRRILPSVRCVAFTTGQCFRVLVYTRADYQLDLWKLHSKRTTYPDRGRPMGDATAASLGALSCPVP